MFLPLLLNVLSINLNAEHVKPPEKEILQVFRDKSKRTKTKSESSGQGATVDEAIVV